uniref:Protein kinase domain-containing protein n=1 Tax=Gopherus agassizii TaxID=38772 RepID=A0A452GPX6_9SAUR
MPWGCLRLREEKSYSSVGDITDKYEIGELLSTKEFCELCLARERRTDRLVVCKRFRKKDGRKVPLWPPRGLLGRGGHSLHPVSGGGGPRGVGRQGGWGGWFWGCS